MKKYFLIITLMMIVLSSCEEDKIIFDGNQTLVAFSSNTVDLPIQIDATGSVDVAVDITTLSTSERTFNVTVVEDETTAGAASYSFGSIVVPANEYNGTLTINGVDDNVTTTPEKLVLKISEGPDFVTPLENLTVNVFQVCPVEESLFTGMYLIEELTPFFFGASLFNDGGTVEIVADGTQRYFVTPNLPAFCPDDTLPFTFNLVCNEVVVPLQPGTCPCFGLTEDYFGPSTIGNSFYDPSDDSVFEVTFTVDAQNSCNLTNVQTTTYRFNKL